MPENITPEEEAAFEQWIKKKAYLIFGLRSGYEWRNKYNMFIAKKRTDLYAIFKKESEEVNKREN